MDPEPARSLAQLKNPAPSGAVLSTKGKPGLYGKTRRLPDAFNAKNGETCGVQTLFSVMVNP